jgi:hypothetical protein
MLKNPQSLIDDFVSALATHCGVTADPSRISHDRWLAPHQPRDLQAACGAVYVFSLPASTHAPAGPGRVLKVGKAGANSNARFRYHHYKSGAALSTLAGAIENNPLLWGYIAYPGTGSNAGAWIKANTDRDNFYFQDPALIGLFEVYAKALLGSVFEGSLSSPAPAMSQATDTTVRGL